jgi:uncharacterized membrane protein
MANPENGLISEIFRTVVTGPGFLIYEAFRQEKFIFLIQMLLPLLFLPFLTKKGGRLFMLIPFVLVCLLPDYEYQHSIDFQYVFGMVPLLVYLAVINLSDLSHKTRKAALPIMALCATAFTFSHMTHYVDYGTYYKENDAQKIAVYEEYLSKIPEEASVEATHIFVPRLSQRKVLYSMNDFLEGKWDPCDYVVLKVGPGLDTAGQDYAQRKVEYLLANGYEYAYGNETYIAVYRRTSSEY